MIRIARLAHARELLEQSARADDADNAEALRASARKILREVFSHSAVVERARDENETEMHCVESYRLAVL